MQTPWQKKQAKSNISTDSVDADHVRNMWYSSTATSPNSLSTWHCPTRTSPIMEACLRCGVNYLDTANY